MEQVLKVKEWQGASGNWYVGDVDTWTKWHAVAEMFGLDKQGYIDMLVEKYHALVEIPDGPDGDFFLTYWLKDDYKYAHKFFLDVNRVARNKGWKVERTVWNHES